MDIIGQILLEELGKDLYSDTTDAEYSNANYFKSI